MIVLDCCNTYVKLEQFGKDNPNRPYELYCDSLKQMYKTFANHYNEIISKKNPAFTGHGIEHTNRILALYDELLQDYVPSPIDYRCQMKSDYGKLDRTIDELFILIAATIWHDAGMLHGRKNHAQRVLSDPAINRLIANAFEPMNSRDNKAAVYLITQIAAAHSDEDSFRACSPRARISGLVSRTLKLPANALAGILRLCDELSDDYSRINEGYWEDLDDKSRIHWLHLRCVKLSEIDIAAKSVKLDYKIPLDNLGVKYPVTVRVETDDGAFEYQEKQVDLLHFILNRIDKVHGEMSVCCPLFYKIAPIDTLEVSLTFTSGELKPMVYPTIKMTNEIMPPSRPDYYDDISKYKVCNQGQKIDIGEIESWFKRQSKEVAKT